MKKDRILQVLQIFLKLALVVTTLIYPLFMDLLTALGWTVNAHSYGAKFRILAAVVAVGALLMTAGVILALCKNDTSPGDRLRGLLPPDGGGEHCHLHCGSGGLGTPERGASGTVRLSDLGGSDAPHHCPLLPAGGSGSAALLLL